MKCALELAAINSVAKQENEWLRYRAKKVREGTIEFCETTINDALTDSARQGKSSICTSFLARTNIDQTEFHVIKLNEKKTFYEDAPGGWKNCKVFKDYLSDHCLQYSFTPIKCRCWNRHDFVYSFEVKVFVN